MLPGKAKTLSEVQSAQAMWEDDTRRYKEATTGMSWDDLFDEIQTVALETLLPDQIVSSIGALEKELLNLKAMREYIQRQLRNSVDDGHDNKGSPNSFERTRKRKRTVGATMTTSLTSPRSSRRQVSRKMTCPNMSMPS